MSTHTALVAWHRAEQEAFTDQRYSRRHDWRFDGGAQVVASSSPSVVPLPMSDPAGVDPEEAFVASLSSCHLLWFLSLAAGDGWTVDHYEDEAEGHMGRDAQGRIVMKTVTLRPLCRFAGEKRPTPAELQALHHRAHEACFLANSVRCEVRCEPRG
ncbi:OsmC family protein [Ideonella sp. YS5]|uniref:OsmC family protein n=1 Tax=Ideonella sp. YS5 TaxID=3453714 RepID=UPI003EEA5E9E